MAITIPNVFCLLLTFICVSNALNNKYSKHLNSNPEILKEDKPFRMHKLNLIWEKARKKLPNSHLEELYDDMLVQDKLEMELKHKKHNEKDEDGELEAAVRNKWFEILHIYGLADSVGEFDKEFGEILKDRAKTHKFNPSKLDPKLTRLWKTAEKSGFSDAELDEFKKELIHQQRKMNEYNLLLRELDTMETMSDNSLEPLKKDGEVLDFKKKKLDLKEKHKELRDELAFLDKTVDNKFDSSDGHFTNSKVIVMWNMARRANFSDEELASLREELEHFEHKLEKHEYLREDLAMSEEKYREKGREEGDLPQHHIDLQERVSQYEFKVKKYEVDIKSKIAKQLGKHMEL